MQPSGSYCYHPASPLARFSTHTYHPAQARAFVILSQGDFWAINHGQKQSHRNICSKVRPFRAFAPRGHLCDLPDKFLLPRLYSFFGTSGNHNCASSGSANMLPTTTNCVIRKPEPLIFMLQRKKRPSRNWLRRPLLSAIPQDGQCRYGPDPSWQ